MSQPVWVLSVDLQAKTATFQSGMADAAKSARGSFSDIKSASADMGAGVSGSVTNVRAALGLLDNSIRGNHAAAMADLVREFSQTSFVMAALPFAAVAGGFLFLGSLIVGAAEKIKEYREEQEKIGQDQTKLSTAINTVWGGLDEKILTAEQRADELRNNHLGALQKELELINRQSFGELIKSFEDIAKAADVVFGDMKNHWYMLGQGADGAKHALQTFQTQYDNLLSQGKDTEAHGLLLGTLAQWREVLALQQKAKSDHDNYQLDNPAADATLTKLDQVSGHYTYTDKEIAAQQTLVETLEAQLGVESRIAALKKIESDNATRVTGGTMSRESSEGARQAAEAQFQIGQQIIQADRAKAEARLAITHASAQQREDVEMDFAKREYDLAEQNNQAQISALDKLGKDYPNELKALKEKSLEIEQQYNTKIAEITSKGQIEANQKAVADLESSERQKIEATRQGSAERLAAIEQAMQAEAAAGLQNSENYRALLSQKSEVERQMTEDAREQAAQSGKLDAENDQKMAQMKLQAAQEQKTLAESARKMTEEQKIADQIQAANAEYAIQMSGFAQQIAALDKFGKDYENKLKELQDKQKQTTAQHENQITQIKDQSTKQRNQQVLSAEQQFQNSIAAGLTKTLTGQRSFTNMMMSLGNQLVSGMMQNALQSIMADDMDKEHKASKAARAAFTSNMDAYPAPINGFIAAAMGAEAFASVMAFQAGTDRVPGVGRGDTVPAMLEPGEGVVPGGVMDGLSKMARSGNMGGGGTHHHYHVQYKPQIHAIDGPSVQKMLKQHGREFTQHLHNETRKRNR